MWFSFRSRFLSPRWALPTFQQYIWQMGKLYFHSSLPLNLDSYYQDIDLIPLIFSCKQNSWCYWYTSFSLVAFVFWAKQKQSSRGVFKKRCSEDMQQIYWRTLMLKCDFSKVAKQLYHDISVIAGRINYKRFQNDHDERWQFSGPLPVLVLFSLLISVSSCALRSIIFTFITSVDVSNSSTILE